MRHGTPLFVDNLRSPTRISPLVRIGARAGNSGLTDFDEEHIQHLIDVAPQSLPVTEIEPAFAGLRSVCRELPLPCGDRTGYVDNLLVNADGRICLVECKLWKNGESIREVVAQVVEYAAALAQLDYEGLVSQIRKALRAREADPLLGKVLGPEIDPDEEIAFMRGVERSLRTGAFLIIIAGDRIRPGIERMAAMLQDKATLGFALALVEMAIYYGEGEATSYYVQPRVLLRTEVITRTVFLDGLASGSPAIRAVDPPSAPKTLTEEEFFSALGTVNPSYPDQVRTLLRRCEGLGCETRLLKRYNIYVDDGLGGQLSVGFFVRNGTFEIWSTAVRDPVLGALVGREYMQAVAQALPGGRLDDHFEKPSAWHISVDGRVAMPIDLLVRHADDWIRALERLNLELRRLEAERSRSTAPSASA